MTERPESNNFIEGPPAPMGRTHRRRKAVLLGGGFVFVVLILFLGIGKLWACG